VVSEGAEGETEFEVHEVVDAVDAEALDELAMDDMARIVIEGDVDASILMLFTGWTRADE